MTYRVQTVFNIWTKVLLLQIALWTRESREQTNQHLTDGFRNHSLLPVVQDLTLQPKSSRKRAGNSQTDNTPTHWETAIKYDRRGSQNGDPRCQCLPRPQSSRGLSLEHTQFDAQSWGCLVFVFAHTCHSLRDTQSQAPVTPPQHTSLHEVFCSLESTMQKKNVRDSSPTHVIYVCLGLSSKVFISKVLLCYGSREWLVPASKFFPWFSWDIAFVMSW